MSRVGFEPITPVFEPVETVLAIDHCATMIGCLSTVAVREMNGLFCDMTFYDRLCGLVVRVLGYRSGGPGSIPGITKKKSSGSGTGSTQPREYN
jgi:hypothetical protein